MQLTKNSEHLIILRNTKVQKNTNGVFYCKFYSVWLKFRISQKSVGQPPCPATICPKSKKVIGEGKRTILHYTIHYITLYLKEISAKLVTLDGKVTRFTNKFILTLQFILIFTLIFLELFRKNRHKHNSQK